MTIFECLIVSPDISIVASDVVTSNQCSQPGEGNIFNQQLGARAKQLNGTQYRKDWLNSKTNNTRSKAKMREPTMRPTYNIPLLTVSNFNFIPYRVKDVERVVEREECYTAQSSQFFGAFPYPTGTSAGSIIKR